MATAAQTAAQKSSREETESTHETATETKMSANSNDPGNIAGETTNQQRIAQLAYFYWQERGCPDGSSEQDWFRAEAQIQGTSSAANE